MKGEIVFINQSSGYLMIDIINEFKGQFDKRVLIAGSILERETKLDPGVTIKKIIPYKKTNIFYRSITWLVGMIQIYFIIIFKHRNAYLFFVSNPPLVIFLTLMIKNKFSILVYDVYPETLFRFGKIKEGSLIVKLWRKANRKAYHKAEVVFTISASMARILSASVQGEKIKVVPIWADSFNKVAIPKSENPFLRKFHLEDKFIVLYSGNIGLTHDIEPLLEVAKICTQKNIFFLIIGNGEKEERIKNEIIRNNLTNCMWLPFQPIENLPNTIGGSDVCVVATGRGGGDLSIPSKTFTLLAAAKPILCISDPGSEMAEMTGQMEFGKSFELEKINEMFDFINELYSSKKMYDFYSDNALKASASFTKENAKVFRDAIIG